MLSSLASTPFASNPIVSAISALYRVGTNINDFLDEHIDDLKKNPNATVRATGNVLDGAKAGFGLGYMSSLVIIAAGQIILGNPLAALGTAATGALMINPIAMTCGAVGAVYYGWRALSEDERNAILSRITEAFQIGVELIKAIVGFLVTTLASLLSSESMEEFKKMIAEVASGFGKSLSDITHSMKDRFIDAASAVASVMGKTADLAMDGVESVSVSVKSNISSAAATVEEKADSVTRYVRNAAKRD